MSEKPCIEVLWAPWRLAYIQEATRSTSRNESKECLFCSAPRLSDEEALIVYRGRLAYVILNKYPYNTGHLMIAPYRHVASPEDLSKEEAIEVFELLAVSVRVLKKTLEPQGFNIGANIGEVAGAGVPGHFHLHIVPRWLGDTNFMVVIGKTKVMPQLLSETWSALRKAFSEAFGGLNE